MTPSALTCQRQQPARIAWTSQSRHASEIGANDVARGLEHALFVEQRLGVEARPPRLTSYRVRWRSAYPMPPVSMPIALIGGGDEVGRAGRKLKMRLLLEAGVDASVLMQEQPVDWRRELARPGVLTQNPLCAVVQTGTPRP